MTDSASKTPETAAAATETATAAASSQMTDTPQPSEPDTPSPTSIAPVSAVTAAPAEPRELVLIEYKESTLHSLEEFAKLQNSARAQKDDLDAMVLNIAKTGQVWFVFFFFLFTFCLPFFHIHMCLHSYPWDLVKLYLAFRLEVVCNETVFQILLFSLFIHLRNKHKDSEQISQREGLQTSQQGRHLPSSVR